MARKYLPFLVLGCIAVFSLAYGGELLGALSITLAFAFGWMQATGRALKRRDEQAENEERTE